VGNSETVKSRIKVSDGLESLIRIPSQSLFLFATERLKMDAKMHDVKIERGSADVGFVEDDRAAKRVVRKMDVRYVFLPSDRNV
jgi:hypothetical protein